MKLSKQELSTNLVKEIESKPSIFSMFDLSGVTIPTYTSIAGAIKYNIGKVQNEDLLGFNIIIKHNDLENACRIAIGFDTLNFVESTTFNGDNNLTQWRTYFIPYVSGKISETADNYIYLWSTTDDGGSFYEIHVTPIADHGHSWSKISGRPTTLSGYGITDGVNNNELEAQMFLHSDRDFANGTIITTSIDYSVSNGDSFLLEIKGNSYGGSIPFDIKVQGYIYSNTIINCGGVSNGANITGLVALNVGGKLTFWFPRQSYWQGFDVYCKKTAYGRQKNLVESITNGVKPTGTKEVALSANIKQTLFTTDIATWAKQANKPAYAYSELSNKPPFRDLGGGEWEFQLDNQSTFHIKDTYMGVNLVSIGGGDMLLNGKSVLKQGDTIAFSQLPVGSGSAQVSPGNHSHNYAPNYGMASQAEAEAGLTSAKYMTPYSTKQAIAKLATGGLPLTVSNGVDKQLVENTSSYSSGLYVAPANYTGSQTSSLETALYPAASNYSFIGTLDKYFYRGYFNTFYGQAGGTFSSIQNKYEVMNITGETTNQDILDKTVEVSDGLTPYVIKESMLNIFNNMNVYTYKRNADMEKGDEYKPEVFMIIEDIEHLPNSDLLITTHENGNKSVDQSTIFGMLFLKIKEQEERIKKLESILNL